MYKLGKSRVEFICPKPLIQMPCLGGASFFSWAHSDLQLKFETPKVRLEATEKVSFRKADTGSGTCPGAWLGLSTNQGTERAFAGAEQRAKAVGEHRDLSHPQCQSKCWP